jgi:hypothetical protein
MNINNVHVYMNINNAHVYMNIKPLLHTLAGGPGSLTGHNDTIIIGSKTTRKIFKHLCSLDSTMSVSHAIYPIYC